MGYIKRNGISYLGDNAVELTQAQYDALVQAGTIDPATTYYVSDGIPSNSWRELINIVYPVGSIYISVSDVNPGTWMTGTTWEAFANGKTLVGVDASDTDFDTVEETGGEKSHTLIESELPKVSGGYYLHGASNGTFVYGLYGNATGTKVNGKYTTCYAQSGAYSYNSPGFAFGNDGAHNNLQPYITTYMWKRTA